MNYKPLSILSEEEKSQLYENVVRDWKNLTPLEIAEKYEIHELSVHYIANRLRKLGVNLPKKNYCKDIFLTDERIKELQRIAQR
jgi:hypothetical protein